MRTEKELLQLVLDNIKNCSKKWGFTGLCLVSDFLEAKNVINHEEVNRIKDFLYLMRPKKEDKLISIWYGNFYKSGQSDSQYFFKKGKKQIRKAWLKYLIKQL